METTIDLDPLCFGVLQRVPKKEESRRTGAASPKNQCECLTRKKCLSHVQETRERDGKQKQRHRAGRFRRARSSSTMRACVRALARERDRTVGRTDGRRALKSWASLSLFSRQQLGEEEDIIGVDTSLAWVWHRPAAIH